MLQNHSCFHFTLFHNGANYLNKLSVLPCGVMFHHKHNLASNGVAHTMFLRKMTPEKPTQGLTGQNASCFVWPLLTQKSWGGEW